MSAAGPVGTDGRQRRRRIAGGSVVAGTLAVTAAVTWSSAVPGSDRWLTIGSRTFAVPVLGVAVAVTLAGVVVVTGWIAQRRSVPAGPVGLAGSAGVAMILLAGLGPVPRARFDAVEPALSALAAVELRTGSGRPTPTDATMAADREVCRAPLVEDWPAIGRVDEVCFYGPERRESVLLRRVRDEGTVDDPVRWGLAWEATPGDFRLGYAWTDAGRGVRTCGRPLDDHWWEYGTTTGDCPAGFMTTRYG